MTLKQRRRRRIARKERRLGISVGKISYRIRMGYEDEPLPVWSRSFL